jgi:secreted PhoX family phosphatase
LRFKPIKLDNQDRVLVAEEYDAHVLIRWGDPVFENFPAFNPFNQSKTTQEQQFGYNCDYVSYHSLPHHRSSNLRQALLSVHHEYTNEAIMFPGYNLQSPTQAQVDNALAAHGGTVIEISKKRPRRLGGGRGIPLQQPHYRRYRYRNHRPRRRR